MTDLLVDEIEAAFHKTYVVLTQFNGIRWSLLVRHKESGVVRIWPCEPELGDQAAMAKAAKAAHQAIVAALRNGETWPRPESQRRLELV